MQCLAPAAELAADSVDILQAQASALAVVFLAGLLSFLVAVRLCGGRS